MTAEDVIQGIYDHYEADPDNRHVTPLFDAMLAEIGPAGPEQHGLIGESVWLMMKHLRPRGYMLVSSFDVCSDYDQVMHFLRDCGARPRDAS